MGKRLGTRGCWWVPPEWRRVPAVSSEVARRFPGVLCAWVGGGGGTHTHTEITCVIKKCARPNTYFWTRSRVSHARHLQDASSSANERASDETLRHRAPAAHTYRHILASLRLGLREEQDHTARPSRRAQSRGQETGLHRNALANASRA